MSRLARLNALATLGARLNALATLESSKSEARTNLEATLGVRNFAARWLTTSRQRKKALAAKESTSNPAEKEKLNWEIYRRGYKHLLSYEEEKHIVEEASKLRYSKLSAEEKKRYDNVD